MTPRPPNVLALDADSGDLLLRVKAVPGASRAGIAGVLANALKVRLAAPPERGRANEELCRLIAHATGARVSVDSGHASPAKTLRLRGVHLADAARALGL